MEISVEEQSFGTLVEQYVLGREFMPCMEYR